jgi:hypothetical protein
MNGDRVVEDMGEVVDFVERGILNKTYVFHTSKGNEIPLTLTRKDYWGNLYLSLPTECGGCSRNLLEEAYDGEMRGRV